MNRNELYRSLITLLAFTALFCCEVTAQEYGFRHYTSDDQLSPLPATAVYPVMQDRNGFVWAGVIGGGLVAYDGIKFLEMKNEAPLDLNYVVSLYQSKDGLIWAYTNSGLLVSESPLNSPPHLEEPVFNNQLPSGDGQFTLYQGDMLAYGLDAFAEEPLTGGMWVATGSAGLIHYQKLEDGHWRADSLLPSRYFPELGDPVNNVYSVVLRGNGELVFVTRGGYIGSISREQRAAFTNAEMPEEIGFRRFDDAASIGVHIALFEDSNGNLWGGTTIGVLWRFDGDIHATQTNDGAPFSPNAFYSDDRFMIFEINEDHRGTLWVGTTSGIAQLNAEVSGKLKLLGNTPKAEVNSIINDREGNIWIGTNNGIVKFSADYAGYVNVNNSAHSNTLTKEVMSVAGDLFNDNLVWAGTTEGLYKVTGDDHGFDFEVLGLDMLGLEPRIHSLSVSQDGRIWGGSNNGFFVIGDGRFHSENAVVENLDPIFTRRFEDGRFIQSYLSQFGISAISHAELDGGLITFLIGDHFVYIIYTNELIILDGFSEIAVPGLNKAILGNDGHLWAGTYYDGLLRTEISLRELLEEHNETVIRIAPPEISPVSQRIAHLSIDGIKTDGTFQNVTFLNDQQVIASTGIGVVLLEPHPDDPMNGNNWTIAKTITVEDGLNFNNPSGMIVDPERDIIWMGGPKGINSLDPHTFEVLGSKSVKDGLVEDFLYGRNAFKLQNGKLLYGTVKGLMLIDPELTGFKGAEPVIHITRAFLEQNVLGRNIFEAEFAGLSFRDERLNTYRYRLSGFSNEWVDAGRDNSIRFTNLGAFFMPKIYRLEVHVLNGYGQESIRPAIYEFRVNPPFYFRWWFLILIGAVIGFASRKTYLSRMEKLRQEQEKIALNRQFEITQRVGAAVAHDIKNSVFSLKFLARNLEKRFENEEFRKDAIETLESTTDHLTRLIQKFQESRHSWEIHYSKEDIQDTVSTVVKRCRMNLPDGVNIVDNLQDGIVWSHDPNAIERVMENLINNAVEAVGTKGTVLVMLESPGKSVRIAIEDDGCGIPEDYLREKLFKPFSTTKKQGIGLGLYTSMELVKAHGGTMDVRSEVGKGTMFVLGFPIGD